MNDSDVFIFFLILMSIFSFLMGMRIGNMKKIYAATKILIDVLYKANKMKASSTSLNVCEVLLNIISPLASKMLDEDPEKTHELYCGRSDEA